MKAGHIKKELLVKKNKGQKSRDYVIKQHNYISLWRYVSLNTSWSKHTCDSDALPAQWESKWYAWWREWRKEIEMQKLRIEKTDQFTPPGGTQVTINKHCTAAVTAHQPCSAAIHSDCCYSTFYRRCNSATVQSNSRSSRSYQLQPHSGTH